MNLDKGPQCGFEGEDSAMTPKNVRTANHAKRKTSNTPTSLGDHAPPARAGTTERRYGSIPNGGTRLRDAEVVDGIVLQYRRAHRPPDP
jgi:hypothetical protein